MILQSLHFIPFCVQNMILFEIVDRISKRLFPSMTLCNSFVRRTSWPMMNLIVLLLSTLKLLQKTSRSTENGITFPDPVKNPCAIPVTINITVLLISSITLLSFRTVYGTLFQQLLFHSTILMIDTLWPISTLKQQLTTIEHNHIWWSLHCEGWTIKGKICASALHSFNEITYKTDEWTKQLLRLKIWEISGNPEQGMEFRRLWWTVIVLTCSYSFSCLISIVCWSNIWCFFWKFIFLFLSFATLSEN